MLSQNFQLQSRPVPDRKSRHAACTIALAAAIALLAGCAGNMPRDDAASATDPWEPLNRKIHRGNTNVDRYTLKPLATGYRQAIPGGVRTGINNFFTNLRSPWHSINNFLQGKPRAGFTEGGRFLFNSTFGLMGLIDVASEMGLEEHREDFGQTLAVWGVPDGPFVMVPFFGPQTLRDALVLPLDLFADPLVWYGNSSIRDKLYVLRIVNLRESFLDAARLLDDAQDPYIRLREAYLQHRRFQIYDGNPPMDDDFYDDFEDDYEDDYEDEYGDRANDTAP
jgi:phospholipid-binding lipoprotein MlaA